MKAFEIVIWKMGAILSGPQIIYSSNYIYSIKSHLSAQ